MVGTPNSPEMLGSQLRSELQKVMVGQSALLDEVLMALIAGGHVLLEGVPGLGKTVLVKTLGQVSGLQFRRVQFTPDLMPSDITGGTVLEETSSGREFVFRPGPIFTNLLLADEINRATPKTQSALLEAMQEGQVTVGGESLPLPVPFLVLATQNPIEMEGTFPLPEAQTDRFLMKLSVERPPVNDLVEILRRTTDPAPVSLDQVASPESLRALQLEASAVLLAGPILRYIARLISATHPEDPACPPEVKGAIELGSSPRGGQALVRLARARALLAGRSHVALEDVKSLAKPVLRHRLALSFEAQTGGRHPDQLIQEILDALPFEEELEDA